MPALAVLGTGLIGSTVARLAVAAGYDVVLANSRGPGSVADLVAELGDAATAASAADVALEADLLLVAVPVSAYPVLPVADLEGKVVIDAGNYAPARDGQIDGITDGHPGSSTLLQQLVVASPVVKAFNTIFHAHLAVLGRPHGAADRSALPVAGDDDAAKAAVSVLLDDLGFDALDIGPLEQEWRILPGRPAYGLPYGGIDTGDFHDPAGLPAGRDTIARAVAA